MTEQRQNFANSDRYTNEDAEINNSNGFAFIGLGWKVF